MRRTCIRDADDRICGIVLWIQDNETLPLELELLLLAPVSIPTPSIVCTRLFGLGDDLVELSSIDICTRDMYPLRLRFGGVVTRPQFFLREVFQVVRIHGHLDARFALMVDLVSFVAELHLNNNKLTLVPRSSCPNTLGPPDGPPPRLPTS